jgi:hypothetical protein|tara:strand:+ start:3530 stop:3898 length:369 start_codon:yes stop_codon:yes gene_type:complete
MAFLKVAHPSPGAKNRGVEFSVQGGTAADINDTPGVLVPALAGHIAVLDHLMLSTTAAELCYIRAGSDDLTGAIHTVALESMPLELPAPLRSDVANEAITIYAASAAVGYWTAWFHYEKRSI